MRHKHKIVRAEHPLTESELDDFDARGLELVSEVWWRPLYNQNLQRWRYIFRYPVKEE
jgi:hypothetical protein